MMFYENVDQQLAVLQTQFAKVFDSLSHEWFERVVVSGFLSLFVAPPSLLLGLAVLIVMDLVTGSMRSIAAGKKFNSSILLQKGITVLVYGGIVMVTTIFTNMFAPFLSQIEYLQVIVIAYLAWIEMQSNIENLTDTKGTGVKISKAVSDLLSGKTPITVLKELKGESHGTDYQHDNNRSASGSDDVSGKSGSAEGHRDSSR